jgi:hypothetical protein
MQEGQFKYTDFFVRSFELRKGDGHTFNYCMVNRLHRLCKMPIQLDDICFTSFECVLDVFVKSGLKKDEK